MTLRLRQDEEVVTVTGHDQAVVLVGKPKDIGVGGLDRQNVTKAKNLVVQFSEQVGKIVGYVLIEQELH